MKRIVFSILLFSVWSCNSKKDICTCLQKGNEVNELSASFFDRPYSVLGKDSLDALLLERDQICGPFQTMSGEKMLEMKKECGLEDFPE